MNAHLSRTIHGAHSHLLSSQARNAVDTPTPVSTPAPVETSLPHSHSLIQMCTHSQRATAQTHPLPNPHPRSLVWRRLSLTRTPSFQRAPIPSAQRGILAHAHIHARSCGDISPSLALTRSNVHPTPARNAPGTPTPEPASTLVRVETSLPHSHSLAPTCTHPQRATP